MDLRRSAIGHVVDFASLPKSAMGKRKSKKNTLTKIDLSILKPKPFDISQHASHNGARVTTILNLVRVPPAPPTDPPASDLDPAGLNGDFEEEENDEVEGDRGEDVSKGPRAARVCIFPPLPSSWLIIPRITPFCSGEQNVTYSLKSSFGSRAGEPPLTAVANSVAKKEHTAASIA